MRKLIWTALVTIVSGAGATAAVRALRFIWRKATHEEPPPITRWARLLVEKTVKKELDRTRQTPTV